MSPAGLCVRIAGSQLIVLFGKVVEHFRGWGLTSGSRLLEAGLEDG